MMRIAILTTSYSALDGRVFHKQAVSLAQAGYAVTLFAPFHPDAEGLARQQGVSYVPLRLSGSRLTRPLRWFRLLSLLRQDHFDVWHLHDPPMLPLLIIGRRLFARQTHLVYDVHEDLPKQIFAKLYIPARLRKVVSFAVDVVERWGMRRCELVVANTDAIARRVATATERYITVRNYPLRSHLVAAPRPVENGRPVRMVYIGGMSEIRGIRDLVLAMHELRDSNVELVLLGRFYPAAFGEEITRIADSRVVIKPEVPFDQVSQYLQTCDIGMVCLYPAPNHIESLPVKMFEYMATGLPIIASNFPLWRNIIEQAGCGLLVEPGQPQHIAAAVRKLLNDPDMRQRMGWAGIQAVKEKYSWQNEFINLASEYDRIGSVTNGQS
jgi:glycosyltransferase involved in cell wall biosynthesis